MLVVTLLIFNALSLLLMFYVWGVVFLLAF